MITSWGSFCHCGEAVALGEQFSSPKSELEQLGVTESSLAGSNPVEKTSPLAGVTMGSCTKGAPATQEASKARKRQMMDRETQLLGKMVTR